MQCKSAMCAKMARLSLNVLSLETHLNNLNLNCTELPASSFITILPFSDLADAFIQSNF